MRSWLAPALVLGLVACSSSGPPDGGTTADAAAVDTGPARDAQLSDAQLPDAPAPDAQLPDAAEPDAQVPDAAEPDAAAPDAAADPCAPNPCFMGAACTPAAGGVACAPCPTGYQGDGLTCTDEDGCRSNACFAGVACTDVPAPGTGFICGACPPGLDGNGLICLEIDGCLGAPCLTGSTCTDLPAPAEGFTCSPCVGASCPILRALAGADQEVIVGSVATLSGGAVGYNGAFSCRWANDRDATILTTCTATVARPDDTRYTLTVTDASGLTASDDVWVRTALLVADAGLDANIQSSQTATLTAAWAGASCPNGACVSCAWRLSTGALVASTCTAQVSPTATTQYFLTVTDNGAARSATDSATVFVTNQPAQLCGWNVVVLTSDEYPTAPNPNYLCDASGTARRQTINGKPAIVLSDLLVENVRITGRISVETSSDDDLIGFFWGWQSPAHAYLLSWKQLSQNWTARCGNAPAGIAIKKIDGSTLAPDSISFNPAFGFNGTDYAYHCADLWSQSRANANLLRDRTIFLTAPADPGAHAVGWREFITYRVEFYYTPDRTRILIYEDDLNTGSTANLVTSLLVEDSSYPAGAFAFFSNSQEQVAFGDFVLASLSAYRAAAGVDQAVSLGTSVTLAGQAELAVPPYRCEWSDGAMTLASVDCALTVTPSATTTYTLSITDDFGRVATDAVTVVVTP